MAQEKGTLAKIAGKTGLGEAMDALEKSYKKVNWKIFDPTQALPMDRKTHSKEGLMMVVKNAKAEFNSNIKSTVQANLKSLTKKAEDAHKKSKSSKAIPTKATEHASKVVDVIDDMEKRAVARISGR